MCMKKFVFKKRAFILLLIGIFVLGGCGQGNNLLETDETNLTETEDTAEADKTIDANFAETEVEAKDEENNEPSEALPEPLEVPVNTQAEEIPYYMKDDIEPLRALHRCIADGENIYLVYGEPDLYIMRLGDDEHSRANIDNPKGMFVCNIAMDAYGRIHLLMAGRNYDEWVIWRLDEDYQIDKVMDISAYFEVEQMPHWFLIDKDGTYYLQWVMNRDGIIVDSEGVLQHRFTMESLGTRWTYEAAVGKDGQIYLVYCDEDEKLKIGKFDAGNCSIIKEASPLCFPMGSDTFSAMSSGTDTNLLLYSPYSGVWACDTENGILENRVPLSDIGFNSDVEFWPLTFLPDGRLLLLGKNGNEVYFKYFPVGK